MLDNTMICNPIKDVRLKLRVGHPAEKKRREEETARWKELAGRSIVRPYRPNTRVHNWQEDIALQGERVCTFLRLRSLGTLNVQLSRKLLARLLTPTQLASPGDVVRFGSCVQLVATEVQGPACGDPCECPPMGVTLMGSARDCTLDQAFERGGLVPGCPLVCAVEGGPCARSSFEIRDECGGGCRNGEPVHLSQPFTLALLGCSDEPLFVVSRAPVHGFALPPHGGQEVSLCHRPTAAARWAAVCADCPAFRLELEGKPVGPLGQRALAIYHQATGRPLAAAGAWRLSYFGPALDGATGGYSDPSDPATGAAPRAEGRRNRWRIVGAAPPPPCPPPGSAPCPAVLPPAGCQGIDVGGEIPVCE